ncbi:cytochrome c-type biogenesis protein [Rubricella aquisinus]|uniref:Cytochrome c-type biogenesis protein n=1 Tax=Rubricella aquisinus TaxID=2028108 RepID=A0A840X1C5_9RHOB|nr:cytochrome c biogenesis protein CcdA [Rubricella aquisinus]MBB5515676.1 cytochrome c-type biogenesis protein [Rubricella aquisinus]
MFGAEAFLDASLGLAMLIALAAGIMSFLSPCVLPIVPPYLAYMAGASMDEMTARNDAAMRRKATLSALFFVMGLSTVFLLMGTAASAFGRSILQYQDIFAKVAGVVVMVFGLHFLGILRIGLLYREARFEAKSGGSAVGAYVLGLAFAFGWTPCIGPILGMILSLAAQGDSVGQGTALLAVYAAGLGIPFILAAFFIGPFSRMMNRFKQHMGMVEKLMGLMLYTIGLMMLTGAFSDFSFWLLEAFPALAVIG